MMSVITTASKALEYLRKTHCVVLMELDNINTALMFSQGVEAGSVWINCYDHTIAHTPFGGFKQSGQGRELGPEGIKAYLEVKTVTIALDQKNS